MSGEDAYGAYVRGDEGVPDNVCTGCGRKLGTVKYSFKSIPGAVFCKKCYDDMKKQIESW